MNLVNWIESVMVFLLEVQRLGHSVEDLVSVLKLGCMLARSALMKFYYSETMRVLRWLEEEKVLLSE